MESTTVFSGEDCHQAAEDYAYQLSEQWEELKTEGYEIVYYQDGQAPGMAQSL